MFDNGLDPFFSFLLSYKPHNDGFIIDGVYYRWVKDYVRYACIKVNCYGCNCLLVPEDGGCIEDIPAPKDGNLYHLYAAYLINHEYEQDRVKDALRVFEENQEILEYIFSWLKQDYKTNKAFFNWYKFLGALHDWGYKLEAVQRMDYWETYAEFLSEYKPRYEGFELCGIHYYGVSQLLPKVCRQIDEIACTACPFFKEIGLKGVACWYNDELPRSNKLKIIYLSWLLMERPQSDKVIHDMMMDFDKNWVAASALFSYINDERYKMVYTSELGWQVKDLKKKNESGAYAAPPSKQETTWPLDQSYSELDADINVVKPKDSEIVKLEFFGPLTMTMDTEGIDEEKLVKILGEQPLGAITLEENKTGDRDLVGMMAEAVAATKEKILETVESTGLFKGVKEMDSEITMSFKIHKALREKPENNGAYWCACADVMDGNILEKCFWREVTFFNGSWCVDDGTLVLAWMALPPSQNFRTFLV